MPIGRLGLFSSPGVSSESLEAIIIWRMAVLVCVIDHVYKGDEIWIATSL